MIMSSRSRKRADHDPRVMIGEKGRRWTRPRRSRWTRRAPEPLGVPVLDSHTHLDIVGGDPAEHIAAAAAVGVDRLVQVGVDVDSSRWGAELAAAYPSVLATAAIHPNEAPRLLDLDEALRAVESLAALPRIRAIGETGLDTFRTGDDGRAAQEASFRAHIAIAKRFGKTLVIHDRDAHRDILRVLDEEGAPDRVVMHCFSGDAPFAADCVRRGFVLSFAGTVTFASAGDLREAAAQYADSATCSSRQTRRFSPRCPIAAGATAPT